MDADSGEMLVAKHSDAVLPIASLTKLMTAMVVLDSGQSLDTWLAIRPLVNEAGKNAYSRIRIGSELQRRELLRIALMSSENLAAYNLAAHHPGGVDAFVQAMNTKAAALSMTATRFVDPTGLSPDNQSTARELAGMASAAYRYDEIRDLSTTGRFTAQFRKPRYRLGYGNTNPLIASSKWKVSVTKTGYLTEAGRCLVLVAEMDGRKVALALLNSFGTRSPLGDAGRIRRWLEAGVEGNVSKAASAHQEQHIRELELD